DLASLQTVVQVATIALAGIVAVVPRDKGPLELAALSAAVLLAVELCLTHWFYLYLPWVLPFVLLSLFLPREERSPARAPGQTPAGGPAGARASCKLQLGLVRGRLRRRSSHASSSWRVRWGSPPSGSTSATRSPTSR